MRYVNLEAGERVRQSLIRDGITYRTDLRGCEGLFDELVSLVCQYVPGLKGTEYQSCRFVYDGQVMRGCKCLQPVAEEQHTIAELLSEREPGFVQIMDTLQPVERFREILRILPEISLQELSDRVVLDQILTCGRPVESYKLEESRGSLLFSGYCTDGLALLPDTEEYPINEKIKETMRKIQAVLSMELAMSALSLGAEPLRIQATQLEEVLNGYVNTVYGSRRTTRILGLLRERLQSTKEKLWESVE